jgi:hypothetical protein
MLKLVGHWQFRGVNIHDELADDEDAVGTAGGWWEGLAEGFLDGLGDAGFRVVHDAS